jgi:hypothetical protein
MPFTGQILKSGTRACTEEPTSSVAKAHQWVIRISIISLNNLILKAVDSWQTSVALPFVKIEGVNYGHELFHPNPFSPLHSLLITTFQLLWMSRHSGGMGRASF